MIRLDPHYSDVIIQRWQDYSGQKAVRADSGQPLKLLLKAPGNADKGLCSKAVFVSMLWWRFSHPSFDR